MKVKVEGPHDFTLPVNVAQGGGAIWYDRPSDSWEWSVLPASDGKSEFVARFYTEEADTADVNIRVIDKPVTTELLRLGQGRAIVGKPIEFDVAQEQLPGRYEISISSRDSIIFSSKVPKFSWTPSDYSLVDEELLIRVHFRPQVPYNSVVWSYSGKVMMDSIDMAGMIGITSTWPVSGSGTNLHSMIIQDAKQYLQAHSAVRLDSGYYVDAVWPTSGETRGIQTSGFRLFGVKGDLRLYLSESDSVVLSEWSFSGSDATSTPVQVAGRIVKLLNSKFGKAYGLNNGEWDNYSWRDGPKVHNLFVKPSSIVFTTNNWIEEDGIRQY